MATPPRMAEFVRLLTAHELRLRAFALSLMGNWPDADEVTQEANLLMFQKFDDFDLATNFFSWASRFVYLTAKKVRREKRRNLLPLDERFMDTMAATAERYASDVAERERMLSECIGQLTSKQRELLALKYERSWTAEQIASVMRRSAESVYKSLSRIRALLFDCVTERLHRDGLI